MFLLFLAERRRSERQSWRHATRPTSDRNEPRSFMKTTLTALVLIAGSLALASSYCEAEETKEPTEKKEGAGTEASPKEQTVAFRTTGGKYISIAGGGGLNASGSKTGEKQTFTLIDLNGGEVADGDKVQIRYTSIAAATAEGKGKSSYWHVEDGTLKRRNKLDDDCTFTVHRKDKTVAFQAVNNSFVSAPSDGSALVLIGTQDDTTSLELVAVTADDK
jgi:hypothetical protein